MKTKFTSLLFLLFITASFAQINIGKSRSSLNLWVSSHKPAVFDNIKTKKTVFVVPRTIDSDAFKSIINEVWTVNEIVFVAEEISDEKSIYRVQLRNLIKQYASSGIMIISLIDDVYSKTKTGGIMGPETRTVGSYISFKFRASIFENIKQNKKNKLKFDATNIAEIFFTPNIRLRQNISYDVGGKTSIGNLDKINTKYDEEPGFYNFNIGYIKNYFQELNNRLSNSKNLKIEDGIKNKEKIQLLKNKTLYVPEWMLLKYNALAATFGETRTKEELFNKYNYKYEIVSNQTINDKILNGDSFFYLNHTQFNQKKIVSVINGKTGEIIYLKEEGSYNVKDSDLKAISKIISK